MKTEQKSGGSNWKFSAAVGAVMFLLALITAQGSVSLYSTLLTPTSSGYVGLTYSGWFFALSILFVGIGMVLVFYAGSDRGLSIERQGLPSGEVAT
jgi:hypothetical protein